MHRSEERSRSRRSPSPRRSRRSPSPRRHRRSPSPSSSRHSSRPVEERDEKALPESFTRDREERRVDDDRNVLERMKTSFDGGPLEDLNRCITEDTKLKVWTRNYKEVRGICTGYLVAFDKHWNLVMRDVDEVFLKPRKAKTPYLWGVEKSDIEAIAEMEPKVPRKKKTPADPAAVKAEEPAGEKESNGEPKAADPAVEVSGSESAPKPTETPAGTEKKKKRKKKKNKDSVMDKRHVGQLFIRGDNIVMVALLNEEEEEEEEEEDAAETATAEGNPEPVVEADGDKE